MTDREAEFVEFVRSRGPVLRRTAFLLCGDWHRAEDLVQTALLKLFRAWSRIRATEAVDAYARTALVRTVMDDSRLLRYRRERVSDSLPETVVPAEDTDATLDARRVLAMLPPRQRAVIVLRYWEDLPIDEVARILGCSDGTVKSQAAKGLATLRKLLTSRPQLLALEALR
ncbi:SigE family RNA polymerase sigma factor [Thermocrispum sp.]|uniref:SigE family RNA polymerase sigma factor n=1 Tax=Thermocrispum agreste TaxID=37925 RepID=A0A2W4LI29_9PSEU|nr:SigE family RNA polymerase sigma factor [Thermocrispum sp.]PZN00780.1 MAG: SigE family RNA polymerase sigma factor [Thermocrispum agreste]